MGLSVFAGTEVRAVHATNPKLSLALAGTGTAKATWTQGTGAPAATEPSGSIYSRTDTGKLYVTQGAGAWELVTSA